MAAISTFRIYSQVCFIYILLIYACRARRIHFKHLLPGSTGMVALCTCSIFCICSTCISVHTCFLACCSPSVVPDILKFALVSFAETIPSFHCHFIFHLKQIFFACISQHFILKVLFHILLPLYSFLIYYMKPRRNACLWLGGEKLLGCQSPTHHHAGKYYYDSAVYIVVLFATCL